MTPTNNSPWAAKRAILKGYYNTRNAQIDIPQKCHHITQWLELIFRNRGETKKLEQPAIAKITSVASHNKVLAITMNRVNIREVDPLL